MDPLAIINTFATAVIAGATIAYVLLTKKLWVETARNAELTEKMMRASNEPLCAISNPTHTFSACSTLTLSFRIQNAGSVPVDSLYLVTEWKGARSSDPECIYYDRGESLGILLPGQATELMRSIVVDRPGRRVVAQHGDREEYEIAIVHVGLSLRFQSSTRSTNSWLQVLLAAFNVEDREFRVRKSEIVQTDVTRYKVYHLLDDVSVTGHGTAPIGP